MTKSRMVKQAQFFSVLMNVLARYIASLPVVGLLLVVLYSVVFDFQRSTATHCHVSIFFF